MDQVSTVFNCFTSLMEQNIRGVQIGCYSVAVVGLTVALRKVKPFSKFKRPSDIPNHFIKERRQLKGLVKRIEPSGALLMIQHKPLLDIPIVPSGQLPVKISGVHITGLGVNWLQAIVAGSEVKFIPVTKEKDYVQCEVLLLFQNQEKKQPAALNVGENLVKIGFAVPAAFENPVEDPVLRVYYNRLQKAERYALRKKMGLKYYIKPTINILMALAKNINFLFMQGTKQVAKVPHKLHKMYAS